jgi:FMN phosphatase YigB (HAD superfamily)
MKKTSLFLLLLASFNIVFAATEPASSEPSNTIFLWDIHYVILKPHKAFRTVLKYPHKSQAFFKNKKLRGKIFKLLLKGMFKESASDHFIHLAEKYDNPYLKELIIQASNSQKPISQTVDIIQELAQNGYTHHIGSNIGLTAFQALTDPQQFPQYAHIFKWFDLEHSHVVAYNEGNIIKKPDPEFFRQYLIKNNINFGTTRIIFIDDKKENIVVAESLGFETIHFKNPAQLRKDLAAHGINISS